jgi:hypothetical protein
MRCLPVGQCRSPESLAIRTIRPVPSRAAYPSARPCDCARLGIKSPASCIGSRGGGADRLGADYQDDEGAADNHQATTIEMITHFGIRIQIGSR